jgi:predicted site-specific integrase-resolvase
MIGSTPPLRTSPTSDNPGRTTRHLGQKELARRWNLSHRTLERWRSHGEGPPFLKLNGRCLYRIEDIEAFEQARLKASTSTTVAAAAR